MIERIVHWNVFLYFKEENVRFYALDSFLKSSLNSELVSRTILCYTLFYTLHCIIIHFVRHILYIVHIIYGVSLKMGFFKNTEFI